MTDRRLGATFIQMWKLERRRCKQSCKVLSSRVLLLHPPQDDVMMPRDVMQCIYCNINVMYNVMQVTSFENFSRRHQRFCWSIIVHQGWLHGMGDWNCNNIIPIYLFLRKIIILFSHFVLRSSHSLLGALLISSSTYLLENRQCH